MHQWQRQWPNEVVRVTIPIPSQIRAAQANVGVLDAANDGEAEADVIVGNQEPPEKLLPSQKPKSWILPMLKPIPIENEEFVNDNSRNLNIS